MSEPITAAVLHEDAYARDPFPVWERLRHEQPLFHDTIDDRWLLTRYDDVAAVFRDHETYSTRPYQRIFTDVIGPTMVQMDGPDHDVRRAIVAPALVGRRLEEHYLGLVDGVVEGLFDRLPAAGPVDLIAGVTGPLPLRVVATILGLPVEEDAYLHEVTNRVIAALAGEEPARSEGIAAHARFSARIGGLIDARERDPGPDLVSAIATGRTEAGEQLSRTEIASFISLLMVAGGETTDRALSTFWWTLLSDPGLLGAVRAEPALLDAAFSEFMRRDGVVVYEDRELTRDVEWHGRVIRAGEIVRVSITSANNDESVFRDPRRFDPARPDLRLGKESRAGGRADGVAGHLGFGLGKHFCIGYQLARAEVIAATRMLLERLPAIAVRPGSEPDLRIRWFHRYVDRLVVERV